MGLEEDNKFHLEWQPVSVGSSTLPSKPFGKLNWGVRGLKEHPVDATVACLSFRSEFKAYVFLALAALW